MATHVVLSHVAFKMLFVESHFFNEKKKPERQQGEGKRKMLKPVTGLPTPITRKSGGFEKQAQKNLEIRASNLETSKLCVK